MNAIEYAQKELNGIQEQIEYYQKNANALMDAVQHLPEEIKSLEIGYAGHYWDKYNYLVYHNPDYFKPLKMAGVMGLKRVFNGGNSADPDNWKWENGELTTPDGYRFAISISKAHKPESCRLEEKVEIVTVKKLVAICPESLEEL